MTNSFWLWDVSAWLSLPLLVLLLVGLVRRRATHEFSFFFSYLLVAFLVGVVRFVVYRELSAKVYYYVYWSSDFAIIVTTFMALYETFLRRIFPSFLGVRLYRFLFPIAGGSLVLLGLLLTLYSRGQISALLTTSGTFDFLCSTAIAFFVVLLLVMGREFSGREFSVAFGFGIQASAALINSALTKHAPGQSGVWARIEPIAYDLACVIWLITFWKAEQPTPHVSQTQLSPALLAQAKSWESGLKDLVKSKKDSERS